jgi:hypothetical protein
MRARSYVSASLLMLSSLQGCGGDHGAATNTAVAQNAVVAAPLPASCDACRARSCSNTDGTGSTDLVAGCYKTPDPKLVPHPDAAFGHDCQAVMQCAFAHDCAYDAALGPAHCYCGSRAVDECLKDGPAPDAPCVAEWKAATRGTSHAEVLERMSLIEFPSGWAFNLLECDRDRCGPKSLVGRCTP